MRLKNKPLRKRRGWCGQKMANFMSIALTTIFVSTLVSSIFLNDSKVNSYAHDSYFVAITHDTSSNRLMPIVVKEDHGFVVANHRESDLGNFIEKTVDPKTGALVQFTFGEDGASGSQEIKKDSKKYYQEKFVTEGKTSVGLAFTFPGVHGTNVWGGEERFDAGAKDEELAYRYANYVITGLNDAMTFMRNDGKSASKLMDSSDYPYAYSRLVDASRKGGTYSFGGRGKAKLSYTIEKNITPKVVQKGLRASDYLRITSNHSGESIEVPYKMAKGYRDFNGYKKEVTYSSGYDKSLAAKGDPLELDWGMAVLQANFNLDVNGTSFSSVADVIKPNQLTVLISGLLSSALGELRQFLGLYSMEELMLNVGNRDQSHFFGIMPKGWKTSANLLFVVCTILAWGFILGAIVKLLIHRSYATISPSQRVSLIEGLKDLISTAFLLSFFPLFFYVLVQFNYLLVSVFASSSQFTEYIGTTNGMSTGLIGAILINIAFFVIDIYFNFQYILRAAAVSLLYGIAPIAIVMIAYGGKAKGFFGNFLKQLVGNIFIQTFHAIVVAFFTSVTATNSLRTIELLVVFYAFIPLTKEIKQNIFGLDGGMLSEAGNLVGTASGVVSGFAGGMMVKGHSKGQGGGVARGGSSNGGAARELGISSKISSALSGNGKMINMHQNKDSLNYGSSDSNEYSAGSSTGPISQRILDGKSSSISGGIGKKALNLGLSSGKAVGHVAKSAALAGVALGVGATGDVKSARAISTLAGVSFGEALSSAGDGIHQSTVGNAGINDVLDSGDNMTFKMAYQLPDNKNYHQDPALNDKFYTTDKIGPNLLTGEKISNDKLNSSKYYDVVNDIANAYTGRGRYTDQELATKATKHYKAVGINGIGTYKDKDGRTALSINVDKQKISRFNNGQGINILGNVPMYED